MLKVLLVDDEPNVRQGIKMMIPWDDLDLEVVGEGNNGDDGLAKMFALSPDIVVTDVKMPGMTGIEMSEAAINAGFKGRIIILTGYSDFTYAKEAISLGVDNFILKPVDEDELIEALKNLRDKILEQRKQDFRQEKGVEYINEQLTKGLLAGDEESIAAAAEAGYNFSVYETAIISSVEKSAPDEKAAVISSVKKFFENCGNVDIVSMDLNGMQAIVFKDWKHAAIMEMLYRLNKSFNGAVYIAVGRSVNSPAELSASYNSAYELYRDRFLYMHYGVVTESVLSTAEIPDTDIDELTSRIYAYIEINDTVKLEKALDEFTEYMRSRKFTTEKVKVSCITLVMNIRARVIKNTSEKKNENLMGEELIEEIGNQDSLYDIVKLLKSTFTEVTNSYFGQTTKSTMERVVQYIRSNYSRELRLEMLAGIFGYNSAYLGKVFHQYTGENFNNYLDEIRISEAKRLLSSDEYKVYEVAEMVGYTNINYFHNKFKKYVGVSPLSYKKSCRGGAVSAADDDSDEE